LINVFIGFDKTEAKAAYVLAHSIQNRASITPSISFINRKSLRGIFTRHRSELDSSDFSISRFLVPYLCNYRGHAIFMDQDMLCVDDIARLWAWRDDKSLRVVKHNHVASETVKSTGKAQINYGKKNWSSLMLFNNEKCKTLTLDYVNTAPGLDLHQFKWLEEHEVGELPNYWNHLVDYDIPDPNSSLFHYTIGGPWIETYSKCTFNGNWKDEALELEGE